MTNGYSINLSARRTKFAGSRCRFPLRVSNCRQARTYSAVQYRPGLSARYFDKLTTQQAKQSVMRGPHRSGRLVPPFPANGKLRADATSWRAASRPSQPNRRYALIDSLGMLLVLRSAVLDCYCLFLAHIGPPLRITVTLAAAEMIDLRAKISPHHRISGTVSFGLGFIRVLT